MNTCLMPFLSTSEPPPAAPLLGFSSLDLQPLGLLARRVLSWSLRGPVFS